MDKIKRTKFNVSLLGEGHVGKTCIVSVHSGREFDENTLMTVGLENVIDTYKIEGTDYKFKIFDTAGQERYRSISTQTIQIADGFLLVFSVDDKASFEHIGYWLNVIEENADIKKKVIIIVGNKIDLENRAVTNEEAANFAKERKLKYFETSAKSGIGINEVFKELYEDIYKKFKENEELNKDENTGKGESNIKLENNNTDNQDKKKKKKEKGSFC